MKKLTTSILLAGVMAATMIGAVHSAPNAPTAAPSSLQTAVKEGREQLHAFPPTPSNAPRGADGWTTKPQVKAPVLGYRFATVIKSQALREQHYNAAASITNAQLDTKLVYSPSYPDLDTCKAASAAVSQLLGANITVKAGVSTASETYKNSDCMPSNGP